MGGLWPAELQRISAETAAIAQHLDRDLQRIVESANEKLRAIAVAGMAEPIRQAEESRVVNVARAFAVLRVESTVRQLRREPLGCQREYLSIGAVPDAPTVVVPVDTTVVLGREAHTTETTVVFDRIPGAAESPAPQRRKESDPLADDLPDSPAVEADTLEVVTETTPAYKQDQLVDSVFRSTSAPEPIPVESADQRLRRLLEFAARQEPSLSWAVGERPDGTTVLVTDVAHGWIPPGITLPAGVQLVSPRRRNGNLTTLLGPVRRSASYRPGDPFGRLDGDVTAADPAVRAVVEIDELGWALAEAVRSRAGLPRMAYTLAKAGAAGNGVLDAEVDVLRVHLDTARYQVLAQQPAVDSGLLNNCLLLAATEALVTGDQVGAGYHFAWFAELNQTVRNGWDNHT